MLLIFNFQPTQEEIGVNSKTKQQLMKAIIMHLRSIYEIIHICTAVVYEVKSDHRSKFSNLSNWK